MECSDHFVNGGSHLKSILLKLKFKRSQHGYCLYARDDERGNDDVYKVIYVDDLLVMGARIKTIEAVKKLSHFFKMTNCGMVEHFLGTKIVYDQEAGKMNFYKKQA